LEFSLTLLKANLLNGLVLTDGIQLPGELEGLRFVSASPVDRATLAALYSDARGQWTHVDKKFQWIDDPSGMAQIVLFKSDGRTEALPRFGVQSAWLSFAMLPGGGWVVSRTRREIVGGSDHDSVIHGADGRPLHRFNAGGAAAFLQASNDGAIWIGHEDDDPDREAKMGGLSLFSAMGEEHFYSWFPGFEGTPKFGMAFWCCYALNVVGETAWTQFYTDMLVSRTEPDGSQRHWRCYPKGAAALIVRDDLIALAGRYDETQYDIIAYRLGEPPGSDYLGQLRFTIDGQQPKYLGFIEGKGDTFHIVHDRRWHRITMDDVLSRLSPPQ